MAFIAINAKADITADGTSPSATTKKGKVTPAQNAMVNAWTLSKKTGIFNTLDKCSASASTPVNGVVTVTFNKGYFSVCGRIVEVEPYTTLKITLPTSGSVSGNIVARFDLSGLQENEFKVLATTDALIQQDLNSNTLGRYDFVLYSYTAYTDRVELEPRDESIYIEDVGGNLAKFEQTLYGEGKPLNGYDNEKGTIEQRLNELGFKKASIQVLDSNYIDAEKTELYSLGKVIYGRIGYKSPNAGPTTGTIAEVNKTVAKITNLTLPYDDVEISISYPFSYAGREQTRYGNITVKTNGDIVIFRPSASGNVGGNVSYASTSGERIVLCDNFQQKTFTGE